MKLIKTTFSSTRNGHIIRYGSRNDSYEFVGKIDTFFASARLVKSRGGIDNVTVAALKGDFSGLEKENPGQD